MLDSSAGGSTCHDAVPPWLGAQRTLGAVRLVLRQRSLKYHRPETAPSMSWFRLALLVPWTLLTVTTRRLRKGPRHPAWSLAYEVVVALLAKLDSEPPDYLPPRDSPLEAIHGCSRGLEAGSSGCSDGASHGLVGVASSRTCTYHADRDRVPPDGVPFGLLSCP